MSILKCGQIDFAWPFMVMDRLHLTMGSHLHVLHIASRPCEFHDKSLLSEGTRCHLSP